MTGKSSKELGLVIFICVYSLIVFGAFAASLRLEAGWLLIVAVVILVIALLKWLALVSIASVLTARDKVSSAILYIGPSIALAIFGGGALVSIIAAALLAVFIYVNQRFALREVNDRISFSVTKIFRDSIRMLASGLLIGILGLALPFFTEIATEEQLRIPEKYVSSILVPLEPVLDNFLPGYNNGQNINEMIEDMFNQGASEAGPEATITPEQKEVARENMSKQLNEDIDGEDTLATIVTEKLNGYLQYLLEFNPALIAVGLIAIAFLTLRVLIPLIVWPSLGVVYLLVMFMLRTRIIHKDFKQTQVERLRL